LKAEGGGKAPKEARSSGKKGEDAAAAFLQAAGMEIVARNVRCPEGEVDIVAIDGGTLVFAEVKSWAFYPIENLEYGINGKKQRRIIETSKHFLSNNRKYSDMAIRFDVIFIQADAVTHIASAFTESVCE
jgi:putative endonuclease